MTFAAAQFHELLMHVVDSITIKRAHGVHQLHTTDTISGNYGVIPFKSTCKSFYLIRICVEIKILQEASGKLTKQEVVSVIYGPQTPVSIVVGACASTEWAH